MSTEECLQIADQLAALGCERAALIGGEVFTREDWAAIAKRLVSQGVRTSIITNGYQMSDSILEEIVRCGIESVAVSLDGLEALHDRFRQPGSFKRAVSAITALSRAGIPVSVISTLNAVTAKGIREFYAFLKHLPIFAWQIQACSPMGKAVDMAVNYRFDFQQVLRFVGETAPDAPFGMGVADNIGYYTKDEGSIRGNLSGRAVFCGCSAGITSIGIDSLGNVRGCESQYDDRFIEGNLRSVRLAEIWNDPSAFTYNRRFSDDLLTGKCEDCVHRRACKAGCRSYNFFVHQKLYESPFCPCTDTAT